MKKSPSNKKYPLRENEGEIGGLKKHLKSLKTSEYFTVKVFLLYGKGTYGLSMNTHSKEYKIGAKISPVIPPGLRDFRMLLVPSLSKDVQNIGCDLFIHDGVHRAFRPAMILAEIAKLVNDAVLDLGF